MAFWLLLLLGFMVGIALVLFLSPMVTTLSTDRHELEIRWTALLRVVHPLRKDGEGARLYLAGMHVPFPRIERKPRKAEPPRQRDVFRLIRFLLSCAADARLRRAVVVQGGRLARRTVQSFELSHWHAELSFADPAANGMLAGWLAATRGSSHSPVGVNFMGRNWLEVEVRLYPYRLAFAGAAFLLSLPHRAIYRHWRHSGGMKA
jgi:hypothetical protein